MYREGSGGGGGIPTEEQQSLVEGFSASYKYVQVLEHAKESSYYHSDMSGRKVNKERQSFILSIFSNMESIILSTSDRCEIGMLEDNRHLLIN